MCDSCGCHTADEPNNSRTVDVHESLLAANTRQALENRQHFESMGAVAINLISGPGSGKTTLLEHTIKNLRNELSIAVIEGDIETERDADRIRKQGAPAVQITTGGACHLDARLVHKGLHRLQHENAAEQYDIIFIENVGNLVCPATFDLGEHTRIVLISVPEGSDKPAKYPKAFTSSNCFLITKTDLLPYFDFSIDEAAAEARKLNPKLKIMELSSTTGEGFSEWLNYLRRIAGKQHPEKS
ncbi:MAG: hydrogenase nickel incorporation protein HypB [Desulfobulbaceae bacterium]|nr:hydrogenase nickel incorporation protein HypB [Desulfobulbaceae bacterium]